MQNAHAQIESIKDDVGNDHDRNYPEPDESHSLVNSRHWSARGKLINPRRHTIFGSKYVSVIPIFNFARKNRLHTLLKIHLDHFCELGRGQMYFNRGAVFQLHKNVCPDTAADGTFTIAYIENRALVNRFGRRIISRQQWLLNTLGGCRQRDGQKKDRNKEFHKSLPQDSVSTSVVRFSPKIAVTAVTSSCALIKARQDSFCPHLKQCSLAQQPARGQFEVPFERFDRPEQ